MPENPELTRTWTIEGEIPMTFTVHQPAVTVRYGDGQEVTLDPKQVRELYDRFWTVVNTFDRALLD
ncbi:hypothetical protein EV193_106384 [Herbihabitans rhizosphaerae]|uniref:Uncharacterized protein n=1 Tax=Herbihabitans rhizosphaerae TaxID=1872711 RepID=A0A4Q7KLK1_9PSEU|nr:hypothetical protein [Herbihabitans rhizosphaerae]RZS37146.1 hypothetical protein EV193_106384 [Herbihabitans rhizosphaerae]